MALFPLQKQEYQIKMEIPCLKPMLSKEAGGRGLSELAWRDWVKAPTISGLKFSYASSIGWMNKG
jgi:hypothetical protein